MKAPSAVEYSKNSQSWMLTFGVKAGEERNLPLGKQFSVIYSPNTHNSKAVWRLVVYKIAMHKNPLNPTAKKSRMYEVVSTRPLNEFEVGEVIAYIEANCKEMVG